jgi:CO dehydrogenase/acetyl-CoA synthase alpha subunit
LKDYVCSQYAFNDTLFTTHYTPEDWDGFVKLLTDTVITHREELLHIAESKSSPDGKERKIRKRYPEEFRFILQHWFPGLQTTPSTMWYVRLR